MRDNNLVQTKGNEMNTVEKQLNSVLKILGKKAYGDIFVYETSNENWIELKIQDSNITRVDVSLMFPKPRYKVAFADYDETILSVRDVQIS